MEKHLSRREAVRLAGVALAGTALAACGGTPTATPVLPTATKPPAAAATTAAVAALPEPKKKVKVVVWFSDRSTINVMTTDVFAKEFGPAHPNIQAEVVFVPEANIPAKMSAASAAGEMPEVSSLDETHIPGLMKQNLLKPIPDKVIDVKKEMGQRVADFYKIPPGPAYYSLPNGCMSGCSMFVNQTVLEKKGQKLSTIPKTWPEFIKFAKDMTVYKGSEISEWGFTFMGCQQITDLAMYQKGSFFYKNNKNSMFGDALNVEAYQWVLDLFDKEKLDFRSAPITVQDRVGQGLAAIGYQWSWATGFMVTTYPNVNWVQIPAPRFSQTGVYGRSSDDLGFAFTSQSKDQDVIDAAWITYRYLVGPDYQRRYVVLRGLAPSLLVLKKEKQFQPDNMQYNGIAVATTPGNFHTDGHWTGELTPMMWQNPWDRVFTANEKPDVVLKDQQAKITKYLADWDLPMLFGKDGWKKEWEQPET